VQPDWGFFLTVCSSNHKKIPVGTQHHKSVQIETKTKFLGVGSSLLPQQRFDVNSCNTINVTRCSAAPFARLLATCSSLKKARGQQHM